MRKKQDVEKARYWQAGAVCRSPKASMSLQYAAAAYNLWRIPKFHAQTAQGKPAWDPRRLPMPMHAAYPFAPTTLSPKTVAIFASEPAANLFETTTLTLKASLDTSVWCPL